MRVIFKAKSNGTEGINFFATFAFEPASNNSVRETVSMGKIIVRFLSFFYFLSSFFLCDAQPTSEEDKLTANLSFGSDLPPGLLAGRSLVLYEQAYTMAELQEAQKYFQQAGIDAINYLDIDYVLSGPDPSQTFFNYFNTRNIKFLIILQKKDNEYVSIFTEYSGSKEFADKNHRSWKQSHTSFLELLRTIYRFAISTQRKENFLINDVPELGFNLTFFKGEPDQRFSRDVQSFKCAIPRWGNAADDKELEALVKEKFPIKCELVDAGLTEAELEQKGYRLVLRFVHTRGDVARDILGYDVTQTATSLLTNYFADNETKVMTMPSKKMIYKFYFKNTEYGNIFLGNKWDADETWQSALRNHILSLRAELKF